MKNLKDGGIRDLDCWGQRGGCSRFVVDEEYDCGTIFINGGDAYGKEWVIVFGC